MKKLLSREEYKKFLNALSKNYCPFCDIQKQIVLGTSEHWTWIANLSPYWPYNTLIVPKEHKLDFDELSIGEFIDLQKFYKKIINHLLSLNLKDNVCRMKPKNFCQIALRHAFFKANFLNFFSEFY